MSRQGGGFRRFGALAAALALFGGTAAVAQQGPNKVNGIVAETPQATVQRQQRLTGLGGLAKATNHAAVWAGWPKRGNRRHRSRWNYNR